MTPAEPTPEGRLAREGVTIVPPEVPTQRATG